MAGMFVGAFAVVPSIGNRSWVLIVAALLGCMVTQCFNDYEDRKTDLANASFRPIPSGRLVASRVLAAGYLCTLVWLVVSALCSVAAAAVVVAVFACVRWYSAAKRITLIHHLLLPAALGLMPIYGALIVAGEVPVLAWYAGLSIFLIDINMNIIGAFKDLWDGSTHERVLPVVWSPRAAVVVALIVGLLGIAIQVGLVVRGYSGPAPLVFLALGAGLTVQSRGRLLQQPSAAVGYAALKSGRLTECLTFPALLAGILPLTSALMLIGALTFFALFAQTLIPEAKLPKEAEQTLG